MELAIYCASRALESFALCLVEWGLVRRRDVPKRIDVLMFSAAAAAIMHCYSDGRGRHRDVFRSKYLNVLDFIFGNTGARARGPAAPHDPAANFLEPWEQARCRLALSDKDLVCGSEKWEPSSQWQGGIPET